jgi:uncharacterized protein (TIGR02145 family)
MKKKVGFGMVRSTLTLMSLFVSLIFFTSCDEEEKSEPIQYGTMVDIDSNVYKTVLIGGKWWMAENLRVTRYSNGDPITQVGQSAIDYPTWDSLAPAYSIHPDATTLMGYLYNFEALKNPAGLAPAGWHIPTDEEWKQLESSLGMESSATAKTGWRGTSEGDALKTTGVDNWNRYDPVWATNSSGFNALSGSCRLFNGEFGYPGRLYTGFWWTASENQNETDKAWYRYLDYKSSGIFRQSFSKRYGCSIRCVKD